MDRISKAIELARGSGAPNTAGKGAGSVRSIEYTTSTPLPASRALLKENRVIAACDDGKVIDSYKLLRTRLLRRMQMNDWVTLGVTSPSAREGKTLTTINLGVSIAMSLDHTALVVDADLRRPRVDRYFGCGERPGLSDYLEGNIPVEEALINPGNIARFLIIPAGTLRQNSSELVASNRMNQLVKELRNRYPRRIVLFDLPPVLVGDDAVALTPNLDAVLLVVQDSKTGRDEFARAVDLLEGVNVVGTVLNDSGERTKGYEAYYA
jgi:protein-tyrosine kinase